MNPHNDFKNPYIWLIAFISIIPSIVVFFILDRANLFHFNKNFGSYLTGLYLNLIISTLPILITYWIIWNKYKKSEDFRKRYKN